MIQHHLSDEILIAYSAGTLPEAFSLVVAAHISLCDECRARFAAFEAVGGALLQSAPQAALSSESLARTLARIREGKPVERPKPKAHGIFPAPLAAYVGGGPEAVRWQNAGGGIRQAILPTKGPGRARLLYIPAGHAVPDHGHRGLELTLVLQGAFRDETDCFARGDVEIADPKLHHKPIAELGDDCICLAATDAPLRFRGLIPRLLQPILRI